MSRDQRSSAACLTNSHPGLSSLFKYILISLFFFFATSEAISQCTSCNAVTFTANLSSKADTSWVFTGTTRSGTCCTGSNCIRFIVYLNPGSDLLSFNVANPAPSGAAFYQVNCGSTVSIGQPACITGGSGTICISYCKVGGDSPFYYITASKTVKASDDFTVRAGCVKTMTVGGLSASTVTWTSVSPGTTGQYNNYLSCTSGCTSTTITPSAATPTLIGYRVSGSPLTGCSGTNADTIWVRVVPGMTANITPTNAVICTGSSSIALTASVSGGQTPYTYSWSTTAATQSISAGVGNYTVLINDNTTGCAAIMNTISVAGIATPTAPAASNNGPVCAGQTLSLTAAGTGMTYQWTGPQSFTSSVQNPVSLSTTTLMSGLYSVTATYSGCTSPASTTSVSILPIPATPTLSSNAPLCAAQNLSLSTTTLSGAGYSWTGPNGFTSNIANPVITSASTLAAGAYSLVISSNGCGSAPATINVTVTATPAAPGISGTPTLCAGSSVNLSASGASSYSWTGPNAFSSSQQNPVISGAGTVATGMYSVTTTLNGCTSPPATFSVSVFMAPSTPTILSNSPVCTGQSLSLTTGSVAGATYVWSGPNGFSSTQQNPVLNNVTGSAAGSYSLSVSVSGCGGSQGTANVSVNTTPAAPSLSSNAPLCAGQNLNLAATGSGAYSWTGPNSFTSSLQNPTIASSSTLASGSYTVINTVNGCPGPASVLSITVNPIPSTPTIAATNTLCSGQTLSLSAGPGGSFSWSGPNSFSSILQNPQISNAGTSASGTYSVTRTLLGCTSAPALVTITVNATPAAPTPTSNSPICALRSLSLGVTNGGASYMWTGPNGFTSSAQSPVIANTSTLAGGTYSVSQTVLGCSSTFTTIAVTVNPAALSPTVLAVAPVCLNGSISFTQTGIAGATYSWAGPNSFSSSNQNPVISNAQLAASGTYSVYATASGCPGPTITIQVLVTSPATITAGSTSTVCANNSTVVLNATSSTGSGTWTSSGNGTFTPNTLTGNYIPGSSDLSAGGATLFLTSTNNGGCQQVSSQVQIYITPAPTAFAGATQTVCANNSSVVLNGSVTVASGGTWTSSGNGTFSPGGSALTATYYPGSSDISANGYTLTLTTTGNGNCFAVSNTKQVHLTPSPVVSPGPNPIVVCKNNPNFQLSGTSSTGSGTWASSGTGTFSSNNILNPFYFSSTADTTAGSITLTLTSTNNGGCSMVSQTTTMMYVSTVIVTAGPNSTVCSNNASIALTGTSTTNAGTWSSSGTGSFSPGAGLLTTSYVPSQADLTAGVVNFTLTSANNGGCNPVTAVKSVTITPGPTAYAGSSQTLCANNASVALNGSFSIAGGVSWTSSGSGSFLPSPNTTSVTYIPSPADTTAGGVVLSITTVSNGNCFATTNSMSVSFYSAPFVFAGNDISVCRNNPAANLNGYTSTGSGTWATTGTGTLSSNSSFTINYAPGTQDTTAGSVKLILTSTNNGGCKAVTDTVKISYAAPPVISTQLSQTVCANNATVALTGTSTTGTGTWSSSGTGTFSQSGMSNVYALSPSDITNGNITLTLTSTGNGGCLPASAQQSVFVSAAPVVSAGSDRTVCVSSPSVTLSGSYSISTGAVWSSSGTGTFTPNSANMNAAYIPGAADLSAGIVSIVITSSGNGNCNPVSDTLRVSFEALPVVNAGADIIMCPGSASPVLNGTATASGVWTTLGTGTFIPGANPLSPTYVAGETEKSNGTAKLVLTSMSENCGTVRDTLAILFRSKPTASFVNTGNCAGAVSSFSDLSTSSASQPITSWSWLIGQDTTSTRNPAYTFTVAGTHTVKLIVSNGCTDSSAKTITVGKIPVAAFTASALCERNVQFKEKAQTGVQIKNRKWSFGDGTSSELPQPLHVFSFSGTSIVTLEVTSAEGCTAQFADTVEVKDCNSEGLIGEAAVPSGFSPDNNGHNDMLMVKGGPFTELDFRVFNDLGQQIFMSSEQSKGWDGTYRGVPQPAGKFIWTVKATLVTGRSVSMAGEVILNR
jgi:gliding motility-associated-like protein